MFARKAVSETALKALMEYAKTAGFDWLLVSADAGNNAPKEFYENIKGKYAEIKLKLDSNITEPYLEAELNNARGKLYKLR
ncbi:MAG: hypothetical protein ACP5JY_01855 [Candidatus Nanoarchaeia archaeon]